MLVFALEVSRGVICGKGLMLRSRANAFGVRGIAFLDPCPNLVLKAVKGLHQFCVKHVILNLGLPMPSLNSSADVAENRGRELVEEESLHNRRILAGGRTGRTIITLGSGPVSWSDRECATSPALV